MDIHDLYEAAEGVPKVATAGSIDIHELRELADGAFDYRVMADRIAGEAGREGVGVAFGERKVLLLLKDAGSAILLATNIDLKDIETFESFGQAVARHNRENTEAQVRIAREPVFLMEKQLKVAGLTANGLGAAMSDFLNDVNSFHYEVESYFDS